MYSYPVMVTAFGYEARFGNGDVLRIVSARYYNRHPNGLRYRYRLTDEGLPLK
jgi:hypothetical protein